MPKVTCTYNEFPFDALMPEESGFPRRRHPLESIHEMKDEDMQDDYWANSTSAAVANNSNIA